MAKRASVRVGLMIVPKHLTAIRRCFPGVRVTRQALAHPYTAQQHKSPDGAFPKIAQWMVEEHPSLADVKEYTVEKDNTEKWYRYLHRERALPLP